MTNKNVKVIIDTNVWISFLIGKRLSILKELIVNGNLTIVVTRQLLDELIFATSKEKLKKYFPQNQVIELIALLNSIAEYVEIEPTYFINRDPKDNFLLDLIAFSKADYLITGDKDLLEHNPFLSAQILTPAEFEKSFVD